MGRQSIIQGLDRLRAQFGNGDVQIFSAVGCHHAGAAAVGDDGKAITFYLFAAGKNFGRGEELTKGHGANHAGPFQGRIKDIVRADHGTGMGAGGQRAFGVAPHFEDDDRLGSCRGAQPTHEGARVMYAFNVEDNGGCLRVRGQIVEHVAEIDIHGIAEGYHGGEAQLMGLGPVQNGGTECAGL